MWLNKAQQGSATQYHSTECTHSFLGNYRYSTSWLWYFLRLSLASVDFGHCACIMNGISGQRAAPRLAEPFPARPRCGGKVVTIRSTVVVSSTDDTSRAALPVRARPPAVTASLHTRRRAHTRRAQNPPHPPHPPPPLTSQLKPEAVNASVHPWTDLTWQAWQAWQATTAISDTSPLRASARFTGRVGWGRRRLRRDEVKINSLSRTPGRLSGSPFPFWNTNARSRAVQSPV